MLVVVQELKRYKVVVVVRVCEATYSPDKLLNGGIQVIDLSFPDGQPPPQQVHDPSSHTHFLPTELC